MRPLAAWHTLAGSRLGRRRPKSSHDRDGARVGIPCGTTSRCCLLLAPGESAVRERFGLRDVRTCPMCGRSEPPAGRPRPMGMTASVRMSPRRTRMRDPQCVRKRHQRRCRLREPPRTRRPRFHLGWLEGRDVGLHGARPRRIGADTSSRRERPRRSPHERPARQARGGPAQSERPATGSSRGPAYRCGVLACRHPEPVHRLSATGGRQRATPGSAALRAVMPR